MHDFYNPDKCPRCDYLTANQPADILKKTRIDTRFSPLVEVLHLNPSGRPNCTYDGECPHESTNKLPQTLLR